MKYIFYLLVAMHKGDPESGAWEEPISAEVENNVTPAEHGQEIINDFNDTLKKGEKPRVYLKVKSAFEIQSHQFRGYFEGTSRIVDSFMREMKINVRLRGEVERRLNEELGECTECGNREGHNYLTNGKCSDCYDGSDDDNQDEDDD